MYSTHLHTHTPAPAPARSLTPTCRYRHTHKTFPPFSLSTNTRSIPPASLPPPPYYHLSFQSLISNHLHLHPRPITVRCIRERYMYIYIYIYNFSPHREPARPQPPLPATSPKAASAAPPGVGSDVTPSAESVSHPCSTRRRQGYICNTEFEEQQQQQQQQYATMSASLHSYLCVFVWCKKVSF